MKLLKFNANLVSFIFEEEVLIKNNINIENLNLEGQLMQKLMGLAVGICGYDDGDNRHILISVSTSRKGDYVYMVFGIDVKEFFMKMCSEYIYYAVDFSELDDIEFDFSSYTMTPNQWNNVEDGTEVEVPIQKEKKQEQSLYFEFNSLQDIEKYAKGNPSINKSDLLQKRTKYVLCITGVFDKTKEFFLEAKIAEFNGVRISPYYSDDILIQQTALEILESI